MEQRQSELTVITKTKDLCSYVITITQKSPKQFRFTFVSRMQNLCLDVIECLYRVNDTFVKNGDQVSWNVRIEYQRKAMTSLKSACMCSSLCKGAKESDSLAANAVKIHGG